MLMDWSSPDLPGTFKLFKQKCEIYFTFRHIKLEKRGSHILLYVGDEGLIMFNAWTLPDNDKVQLDILRTKFKEHLEQKVNFRVQRYYLQRYNQTDDYTTRCKLQSLKYKFKQAELAESSLSSLLWARGCLNYRKKC